MNDTESVREEHVRAEAAEHANWGQVSHNNGLGRSSVSLTVSWGDEVLLSQEVNDKSGFTLGANKAVDDVDFAIAEEHLGAARWNLVRRNGSSAVLQIPASASGFVEFPGESIVALDALRAKLGPLPGGHELALPIGARAVVQLGNVSFDLVHARAEARWARTLGADIRPVAGYFTASFVSAAALLMGMAFFVPPMGLNDGEQVDADRVYLLQQYLDAAAEREEQEKPEDANTDERAGGQDGARAAADEGALGKPEAKTSGKIAIKGPATNPTPELSAREQAVNFGMIGLLAGGFASESPSAPWARDAALGSDPLDANGAMWGEELGESAGNGGLGLSGLGEGGGGIHQGIGLVGVNTIGGQGNCFGSHCGGIGPGGFGRSFAQSGSGHKVRVPVMRVSEPTVTGRLPPQTIQRIVRNNFGRFRSCYEKGLSQNPNLEGRVQVRFLIDRSGAVASALNAGSAMPDSNVVSCVVRAFYGLSFPTPDNGSVQVSYPIMFSPG